MHPSDAGRADTILLNMGEARSPSKAGTAGTDGDLPRSRGEWVSASVTWGEKGLLRLAMGELLPLPLRRRTRGEPASPSAAVDAMDACAPLLGEPGGECGLTRQGETESRSTDATAATAAAAAATAAVTTDCLLPIEGVSVSPSREQRGDVANFLGDRVSLRGDLWSPLETAAAGAAAAVVAVAAWSSGAAAVEAAAGAGGAALAWSATTLTNPTNSPGLSSRDSTVLSSARALPRRTNF